MPLELKFIAFQQGIGNKFTIINEDHIEKINCIVRLLSLFAEELKFVIRLRGY